MNDLISHPIFWWVATVDVPIVSGVLWLLSKFKREGQLALRQIGAELTDLKLGVARDYAAQSDVREVEKRLIAHLQRIEVKLDRTVFNQLFALQTKTTLERT